MTKKRDAATAVVQVWLALGWGYGVLWYIYLLTPDQGMTYYFSL